MREYKRTKRSEEIIFNGVIFRRYPDSSTHSDKWYFKPITKYLKQGYGSLHREIWKAAHGPIPPGHHIHHKDGNPLNNSLDNLECVPSAEHLQYHGDQPPSKAKIDHLEKVRHLAAQWHRSEEGRNWHSQHGKEVWQAAAPKQYTCEQCGRNFESATLHGKTRFCSNNCKAAWRRASGVDNEIRKCACCGAEFSVNRYFGTQTCSRRCGASLRRQKCRQGSGL